MKKLWVILVVCLLFTGCGSAEIYETVEDDMMLAVSAVPRQIQLSLPEEAILPTMESEHGQIYICRDYDVMIQTLPAGDLSRTIAEISGYSEEDLQVIKTTQDELERAEFVWSATGELGDTVGRAAVLNDGHYHYVLTATIAAEKCREYQEIWNGLFESFHLR